MYINANTKQRTHYTHVDFLVQVSKRAGDLNFQTDSDFGMCTSEALNWPKGRKEPVQSRSSNHLKYAIISIKTGRAGKIIMSGNV